MKQNEEIARQLLYTLNAYNWAVNRYSNEKMEEIDIGHIIKVLSAKDQEYKGRIEEKDKEIESFKLHFSTSLKHGCFDEIYEEQKDLQAKIAMLEKVSEAAIEISKQFRFVGNMQRKLLGESLDEAEKNWDFASSEGVMNFEPLLNAVYELAKLRGEK